MSLKQHSKFSHSQTSSLKSAWISIPNHFDPPCHDPTKIGILCSWIMGCKDASSASHHCSGTNFQGFEKAIDKHLPFDAFENPPPQKNEYSTKGSEKKKTSGSCCHLFCLPYDFSAGESFFFPSVHGGCLCITLHGRQARCQVGRMVLKKDARELLLQEMGMKPNGKIVNIVRSSNSISCISI